MCSNKYMAKGSISNMVDLQKKAEELYPLPIKSCSFVKAKIKWLRERWIASEMNAQKNTL